MKQLLVITYIPSPYQVEFFNAIALSHQFNLRVAYLYPNCNVPIAKEWRQPDFAHDYLILNDCPQNYQQLEQYLKQSDLIIFNYYRHPRLAKLMTCCISLNKSWCFWGERPGFKHLGILGQIYRYGKLYQLHRSSAAIWGAGNWGVGGYQKEFGRHRQYFNLPYFSDLNRFTDSVENGDRLVPLPNQRVFLYSGALIERKGVDLLASAFCRLAAEFPDIDLHLLGDGALRPKLEEQLAQYQERVKFIGFQPWDKLPHYYQQANILCAPSRYDGWGLVVPEGLAAGLPVISTNCTGAAIDLIKNEVNGWLIDANNEKSLYQAMYKAIVLSPTKLAQYSQAAKDCAALHSLENGVQKFHRAVTKTLEIKH